jgi:hypothetical protein
MATTHAIEALAHARERAADDLEHALVNVGLARARLAETTAQLEAQLHVELGRHLDGALTLHLVRAGFSGLVERKLHGEAPSLRDLVADQHTRVGIGQ